MLRRLLALPFYPPWWREARSWTTGRSIVVVVGFVFICQLVLAGYRSFQMFSALRTMGAEYAECCDPIVVSEGVLRVDGPRRLHEVDEEHNKSVLIDPDYTINESEITTPEYVVIRSDVIVRQRYFERREFRIAELQKFIGVDPLVIDEAHLKNWADTWGILLTAAVAVLLVTLGVVVATVSTFAYAVPGALVARVVRRNWDYTAALRVALWTTSAITFVSLILNLGDWNPTVCARIPAYFLFVSIAATWALGTSAAPVEPQD